MGGVHFAVLTTLLAWLDRHDNPRSVAVGLVPAADVRDTASMLRTKSIHSPKELSVDGLRILATRFRGRGLTSDRYDVWMPNLAPSEKLLKGFLAEAIPWREFVRRYREQMGASAPFDEENRTIKNHGQKFTLRLLRRLAEEGNVTLLCHCAEDDTHCHRHILKTLIERA
jgi:uncharacterized protein YeaO (DUF488 family)